MWNLLSYFMGSGKECRNNENRLHIWIVVWYVIVTD